MSKVKVKSSRFFTNNHLVNYPKLKIIASSPLSNSLMPVVYSHSYRPPFALANGHLETIYPALMRSVKNIPQSFKKRISTPDGDFLDLDLSQNGSKKLVVVQHGLEGSSDRAYMQGMGKIFFENGFDTCLWNFRGCSGELNSKPIFYHSGATYDLQTVIEHLADGYEEIYLIGFSLGGNLTLKFLGEAVHTPKIKKAVVFSVPLDLAAGSENLATRASFIYESRFLRNLGKKVRQKALLFPNEINVKALDRVKSLRDFDEFVTAPLHGFESAKDYYQKCSAANFLEGIRSPTLIVNALNDPLLTPECLDPALAQNHDLVTLELTARGGHVGFSNFKSPHYWSERRALSFIQGVDMAV